MNARPPMSEGTRVAAVADITEGEGIVIARSITGTDDDVALLRDDDGSVWALDNTCTHAEASLAEGWVDDGQGEGPLHSSNVSVKRGAVAGLPATKDARPHRVEVRDGQVFLYPGER